MAKVVKGKFPQFIFVRYERSGGGGYFVADEDAISVIDDDGPTHVGTYELKDISELSKRVVSKPIGRKQ